MAGPFEDAVGKFANDEYSDTEEAVDALATSGNPLAYTIISALQDGRLMADPDTKKIYRHPARRQDHRCRDRRRRRQHSRQRRCRAPQQPAAAHTSRPRSAV